MSIFTAWFAHFNAPSLPFQGNQAVNAAIILPTPRGRRPPPYSGAGVWSIVPYICRRATTERCLASGGWGRGDRAQWREWVGGGEGTLQMSRMAKIQQVLGLQKNFWIIAHHHFHTHTTSSNEFLTKGRYSALGIGRITAPVLRAHQNNTISNFYPPSPSFQKLYVTTAVVLKGCSTCRIKCTIVALWMSSSLDAWTCPWVPGLAFWKRRPFW